MKDSKAGLSPRVILVFSPALPVFREVHGWSSKHVSVLTPKITPADSKRLHNHSTEVAEIFVGGLLKVCHEIPTRHRMKYSLSRSESEFEQVTARVQVDSHVKDQS